ncbi:MAG: metal-sulfur cluster assembly factor [Gemmatimonadaceae bacterium]
MTTVTPSAGQGEIFIYAAWIPEPGSVMETSDPRVNAIWTALATVIDPELERDIVTLGLVYDVVFENGTARITHTLTTQGCPMERVITDGIRRAVAHVGGVAHVETHIVWDPAWHPGMIAANAFPD